MEDQRSPDRRSLRFTALSSAINGLLLLLDHHAEQHSQSDLMRALLSPACGVVQDLWAGVMHQRSCICALDMALIQPAQWASSSSSGRSSNSTQPHPGQLLLQRGKHTVRMVLLKVGTAQSYSVLGFVVLS
jgi:hypothetical protein